MNEQTKKEIGKILDEIEDIAEKKMAMTHKLEGSHYAALKTIREKYNIPRKITPSIL